MKIVLTTLNAKYIHKNLALRWLYVARDRRHHVSIHEYTIKEDIDYIADQLVDMNADVIAFSVYIWNVNEILAIIKKVKRKTNAHIVVGGPEVSFDSFDILNSGVDAICIGEGEIAFWQYISQLEQGTMSSIDGIYTKEFPNRTYAYSSLAYNETLQNPYFLSFDQEDMGKRYLYFETSRGCPYRCEYCLSSTDQQVRMFREDYVFDVLKQIASSDVRIVKLLDRTFNVQPERALQIARFMNQNCQNQIFQFEIVAETLSDDLLTFFCEEADKHRFRFEIGVQSFYPKTLDAVGRIQNNKRLIEVINRLQRAGIVMHVDLIAGLPYEGFERFRHSFNTLYELHAAEIQLGILKLLKGTLMRKKKDQYEFEFNEYPPYDVKRTKWLTKRELDSINKGAKAVEKFYNSGRLRASIDTILSNGEYKDAFRLFVELGERMDRLQHPYQPHELFQLLKDVVSCKNEDWIDGVLKYDYYRIFKQKPKRFLKTISKSKRQDIMKRLICDYHFDEHQLQIYGYIDTVFYDDKLGYQLILYSSKQTFPKRWFIDHNEIKEIL